MIDLEIPLKRRTRSYRFFEMLPGLASWGSIIILLVLSLLNPVLASIYVLLFIATLLIKAGGIAYHTLVGFRRIDQAQEINWSGRLNDLANTSASQARIQTHPTGGLGEKAHLENLRLMAAAPGNYPKPAEVYHAVIIATYNEPYEVLQPTIESVVTGNFDPKQIILVIAYEERGGAGRP